MVQNISQKRIFFYAEKGFCLSDSFVALRRRGIIRKCMPFDDD